MCIGLKLSALISWTNNACGGHILRFYTTYCASFFVKFQVKPTIFFFRVLDLVQTDSEFVGGGGGEREKI